MTATATRTEKTVGTIVQVIGPVLDVEFPPEQLPELYNALTVFDDSGPIPVHLVAEVQQHIGRNQVRAVAMSSTDGVSRGMQAVDTGSAVSVHHRSSPRWSPRPRSSKPASRSST